MSPEAYVPPELASSARELIMAFGHWCDANEDLVQQDEWSFAQLVDMFLMECGANDPDPPETEPDAVEATRGVLLLRDRLGREWTAGVLIAPAEAAGAAALPLASQEARRLDLRLVTFKVVEE